MHGNMNVKYKSVHPDALRVLWNSNFDHFVHKSPPPEYCLRQVILIYNFKIYSTNVHFNIVLQSTTKSPKLVFPSSVQINCVHLSAS